MYVNLYKRLFDLFFSICLLILFSPVMMAVAIVVKLTLGSPILFRQKRPGLQGQPFEIYKFRTMTNGTDEAGQLVSDEKRVTKIGQLLRKYSVDELPQLINVIKGEMSLIGPRPLMMEYLPLYNSFQKRRHEMKPGLTGWAQVNGRNAISWDQKFKLDVWYVDHCSLYLDLKIMMFTLKKVVSTRDVQSPGHVNMPFFTGNNEDDRKQNTPIFLSPPDMGEVERNLLIEAFDSNWIAPLGPHVDLFEKEFAEMIGSKGAVATSSGTAALHLALRLLDVGPGDLVFCSSLTFVASANPILYQGAEPIFIDSDRDTWNMCPQALRKAFEICMGQYGKLPKAVIVVNLYGQCAKYDEIKEICDYYHVPIIEDAAESLGATYKGKPSGTFGEFGVFSFNGNKIITTSGGGMLVSENLEALKKARYLASQARLPAVHYQHEEVGYNYRLSNLLAAVGRGQLTKLSQKVQKKREIFNTYCNELSMFQGIEFMPEMTDAYSTKWLTCMIIDQKLTKINRNLILEAMQKQNIEARPVWKPLHLQPVYKNKPFITIQENGSVAEHLFKNGICLPSGTSLTTIEQKRVIHVIKSALGQNQSEVT
ncbi:dTDP-4-amino-4,6-dideoxygalactose transaminase/lipopolysaccharide/colanic/teichoic acid biosynthesis glycosyltransferase [Bacillus mesophilus]|uniref:Aminotransferase class I/II-fold pyridoxal phosphate-dependent enzyme n=1 Tax=Bacillus mesophilus TaxID=1808955 RepID=A0A6M0QCJ6_9BACI|nr:dTDP-4-amino-4,6-dideoxygalactose transaminase/lipopolysaccharide/colanic/teichoic acid biosynthesis glycosyltransferase [Bacillus mesophilus]NEY73439.1 aminotransferase class I/II-fold pyridoxal phosphate-dependent enzyme [Bacillus mesophilus]